jgi:hypothetical protein
MRRPQNARHLAWLRGLPCAVPGCRTLLPVQAHHVRSGATAGVALKPLAQDAVPLCLGHHEEGHTIGWRRFEMRYDLDLGALAKVLAAVSPWLGNGGPFAKRRAEEFSG